MKTKNNPQIIITGADDTFHLALWDQKNELAGQLYMTMEELTLFVLDAIVEFGMRLEQNESQWKATGDDD